MSSELRRSNRHTDFIPVSVFVKTKNSDDTLTGPFSGTIVDICSYGACLLMSQIKLDSFHIFHSTRQEDSAYLHIKINLPHLLEGINIDAKPIWLNTFQREDFQERMIGIEFFNIEKDSEKIRLLAEQL
jgi:hypothetical protein